VTVRLTVEEVIAIFDHELACGSLRDPGSLEGAVEAPFFELIDFIPYPTLVQKAGKLLDGIQRVQPYSDGNKRLAWLATTTFLQLNGQVVDERVSAAEVDEFVRSLAWMPNAEVYAAQWLNLRVHGLS